MRRFPLTLDTDSTGVRDALQVARTQYARGDLDSAIGWIRRAAELAFERHDNERGVALSTAAADLAPPRPSAAVTTPPRAEPMPMHPMPARPSAAPPRGAPVPATSAPAPGLPRSLVSSRPVPIPRNSSPAIEAVPDESASEPIPLTARKIEPFDLDDDSTHVGAAPAGFLAAVAAEAQCNAPLQSTPRQPTPPAQPARTPQVHAQPPRASSHPSAPPPRAAAPAKPAVAPAKPAAPARTTAPAKPAAAPAKPAAAPAKPAAAKSSPPAAKPAVAPSRAAEAPPAKPAHTSILDDEEDDQTNPGISPQAIQAMAASRPRPPVHAALRVALSKGATGVTARAVERDGLRPGEVEVMVVATASDVDLAALFG